MPASDVDDLDLWAPIEPITRPEPSLINPTFIPPLTDVIEGDHVYKWFRFEYRKGLGDGLGLFACGKNDVRLPYVNEIFASTDECLTWALKNGIAPGQPFLLKVRPPSYDYETGDPCWDLDFSTELVQTIPQSFEKAIRSWDRFFRWTALQEAKRRGHVRHLILNGSKHWELYLFSKVSPTTKLSLVYQTIEKCKGATFVKYKTLLEVKIVSPSFNEAFWELFRVLEKDYPGCDLEHLLRLAKKSITDVSISRWYQIRFGLVQTSGDHPQVSPVQ